MRVFDMPNTPTVTPTPDKLLERAIAGGRISLEEGIHLYERATSDELQRAADAIRAQRHPEGIVT
jgi:2-iminoacetate synthase ThiH